MRSWSYTMPIDTLGSSRAATVAAIQESRTWIAAATGSAALAAVEYMAMIGSNFSSKCLLQIGDQIADVFDAGRIADQGFGNSHGGPVCRRDFDMAGGGRRSHDCFYRAQICGPVREFEPWQEGFDRVVIAA